jgi:hypothetical protein
MAWIGVHYEYPFGGMMADRPEWMPKGAKDWRRDLEVIKDTGFNLIRIRVGLDSDIDDIATLLDICRDLDIKVEFGFAMFYVSNEFVRTYPDSKTVYANGRKVPQDELDYSWPRVCVHHPVFRSRRDKFIDACAARFKDHPVVIAWDVHNEPSLDGCYCDHTLAVYRKAVEKEFGNVEAYNTAFGASFGSLADVVPPKMRNENVAAYRHWRQFMTAELNRFLNEGRDIVRKHVPDLPIAYNPTDPFGTAASAQDWWNLRGYGLMSCSMYWGSSEHTPGRAAPLELLKALGPGKDLWIAEFQGGGFTFSEHLLYTGKHMVEELNAAFAHGIQGVIYYRWDPLLAGPEPWINGMTAVDTYDTEKRLTLKKGIAELRKYEAILDKGRSIRPSVGMFLTREQVLHSGEFGYDIRMAVTGNYSLLSALGYEMAFVLDKFDPATCPYDVMIFPYMYLDAGMVPAIREYAKSGRRAIVELPPTDVEAAKAVGAALGLNVTGREQPIYWFVGWDLRGTGEKPGAARGKYMGFAADERLFMDAGKSTVLANYGLDGKPAIVTPDGCDGNLLAFGFPLGRTHARMLHHDLRNFVGSFIRRKVRPDIVVKGACDEYRPLVEARVIETDKEGLLFVINRGLYDYDLEVAVKGYKPAALKSRMYSVARKRLRRTR